jgi:tetratricopeptide (TPR) repeat protein
VVSGQLSRDPLLAASARALSAGDVLGALKGVALREDPPALALRGIAMAQLGEYACARELLRRAARAFGAHERLARARCLVAEAEVALAMRDFGWSPRSLAAAQARLGAHGDRANAVLAELIAARRLLLLGRLDEASSAVERSDFPGLPPAVLAMRELVVAELALRSLKTGAARAALQRANEAARKAGVSALRAEVAGMQAALDRPAARLLARDGEQPLRLDEVEALLASSTLVLDTCRRGLRAGSAWRPMTRRPVLLALALALARAWPDSVDREVLIAKTFRIRRPDETDRSRLRVEVGRLRTVAKGLARIEADSNGYRFCPEGELAMAVLAPPIDGDEASMLALLADGEAWSSSALALALGTSQRTVQRTLAELETAGKVRSIGRTRARRWLAPPLAGFTSILLLPAALPNA